MCYLAARMTRTTLAALLELPADERLRLVEQLWDSIAATPESVPVSEEQGRELDCRLQSHRESPERAAPWDEVRERLTRRL